MSLLPYGRHSVDGCDEDAVLETLRSEWLTQGPRIEEFERALARATGARFAVAVSSGTAALHLSYLALGLGPGDVLATSPITFAATANAALYCGARPEFVDIDSRTLCLDPTTLEARLVAGLRPKLVVPVHFAGLPCDMARLAWLADRYGFRIVEDACHALGARYECGGATGTIGDGRCSDAAVFSFHPVKHITTGEGGAVVTNSREVADRVRTLRSHGITRTGFRRPDEARGGSGQDRPWYYEMHELGFNYRITDLQCALGLSQLKKLDRFVERRRHLADRYDEVLAGLETRGVLTRPREAPGRESSWHLYPVRIPGRRDAAYLGLRERGIGAQVHYVPVHLHPFYRDRFGTGRGDCPVAEGYFDEALSLPLHPGMTDNDVDRVSADLVEALATTDHPGAEPPRALVGEGI